MLLVRMVLNWIIGTSRKSEDDWEPPVSQAGR